MPTQTKRARPYRFASTTSTYARMYEAICRDPGLSVPQLLTCSDAARETVHGAGVRAAGEGHAKVMDARLYGERSVRAAVHNVRRGLRCAVAVGVASPCVLPGLSDQRPSGVCVVRAHGMRIPRPDALEWAVSEKGRSRSLDIARPTVSATLLHFSDPDLSRNEIGERVGAYIAKSTLSQARSVRNVMLALDMLTH